MDPMIIDGTLNKRKIEYKLNPQASAKRLKPNI